MVYDPAETRLLQLAKARGCETIPGSEMFVHQAARQFEIWTGKPAPREDMLRIVSVALADRAAARSGQGEEVIGPNRIPELSLPNLLENARAAKATRRGSHCTVKAASKL